MALDRFYVPTAGIDGKTEALMCGFRWLLSRPETELHVAFHRVEALETVLDDLAEAQPRHAFFFKALKKDRHYALENGKKSVTCAPTKPQPQARPNGACLVIWAGATELDAVEKKLGPVGGICAVPWFLDEIKNWIAINGPTALNC